MAKGLFTQGMCVLLRSPMSMAEVEQRLSMFKLAGKQASIEDDAAPETLVLEFRPEVDGHLMITPAASTWPDDMGEPDEHPEAFVAWSLGQFGPLTFPGCLGRALAESGISEKLRNEVIGHTAHVRLLISYVLGAEDPESDQSDEDLPLMPNNYDPIAELHALTRAVTALLESPLAICYFNPGGEILLDSSQLRRGLNAAWSVDEPPLDVWVQTRRLTAGDSDELADWKVIDTVGNEQLDAADLEAVYCGDQYREADVTAFLRRLYAELLDPESIQDPYMEGELRDGPGGVSWYATACQEALNSPPRETIRWIPEDGRDVPEVILDTADDDDDSKEDWLEEEDDEIDFIDDDWDEEEPF